MRHVSFASLIAGALFLGSIAGDSLAAKLYKWVDEQGNVTYSQLPPPKGESTSVELKGLPAVSNDQAQERLGALRDQAETARKDREFKSNFTSETRDREERLKENCEIARQNMRILNDASRVKDTEGNFVDEAQRDQRKAQAQKQIDDFCS